MNKIKVENWNGHEVRFVEVSGEWWGIAKDIAEALKYSDTNAMTRHLKSKFLTTVKLTGMNQSFTAISEQGIYKAITRSQRPEAENFEDWIFDTIKQLRQVSGLEGFQVFRMLDKEHQREMMDKIKQTHLHPSKRDYIKANTIADKAVSTKYGYSKMLKKEDMTPDMLMQRQSILEDTVELMVVKEKYDLSLSVSENIYKKYEQ